jgi:mannose-1-phosphate guanylyltransferase
MKAVLLCAGFGTRLRPVTNLTPKCLVEIDEVPLLEIWLSSLLRNGISEVLINTHYLAEKIVSFVQKSQWADQITVVHEEELLGTAATISKNSNFFSDEPVMIIHADNLAIFSVENFIQSHHSRPVDAEITMIIFDTLKPKECGIVELDENNIVQKFHEKVNFPPGSLANGAVYIFERTVIDFIIQSKNVKDISTEVLPNFLGKIGTFKNETCHIDIGTLPSLKMGNSIFFKNREKFKKIVGLV